MLIWKLLEKFTSLPIRPKMLSNRPFTIAVEGNVGSGKTTFLEHMEKIHQVTALSEPVEMWRNCSGHNILSLMYEDPMKWSFTFQSYVQLTMLKNHLLKTPGIKIMERSIHSARYCFVERLVRDGLLPAPSFTVVDEWYKFICANHDVSVDLIVYLRTSPEVAFNRVVARSRVEEKTVSLEFIKDLHEIHEKWLYYKTVGVCPAPVFTLNADLDLAHMEEEYEKLGSSVLNQKSFSLRI